MEVQVLKVKEWANLKQRNQMAMEVQVLKVKEWTNLKQRNQMAMEVQVLKVKEWTNLKQKGHMVVQVTDRKYEASGLRNLEDQKQKQDDHMVNVENVEK
ncbi:hypothetical protein FCV25MIE_19764 [Fagus crenata]